MKSFHFSINIFLIIYLYNYTQFQYLGSLSDAIDKMIELEKAKKDAFFSEILRTFALLYVDLEEEIRLSNKSIAKSKGSYYNIVIAEFTDLAKKVNSEETITLDEVKAIVEKLDNNLASHKPSNKLRTAIYTVLGAVIGGIIGAALTWYLGGVGSVIGIAAGITLAAGASSTTGFILGYFHGRSKQRKFNKQEESHNKYLGRLNNMTELEKKKTNVLTEELHALDKEYITLLAEIMATQDINLLKEYYKKQKPLQEQINKISISSTSKLISYYNQLKENINSIVKTIASKQCEILEKQCDEFEKTINAAKDFDSFNDTLKDMLKSVTAVSENLQKIKAKNPSNDQALNDDLMLLEKKINSISDLIPAKRFDLFDSKRSTLKNEIYELIKKKHNNTNAPGQWQQITAPDRLSSLAHRENFDDFIEQNKITDSTIISKMNEFLAFMKLLKDNNFQEKYRTRSITNAIEADRGSKRMQAKEDAVKQKLEEHGVDSVSEKYTSLIC